MYLVVSADPRNINHSSDHSSDWRCNLENEYFEDTTIKTKVWTGLKLCRLRSNLNVSFRQKGTKIEMYNPTIHT